MALGTIIALFIVSLVILIVSLVYASRASTSLQAVSNYSTDTNLDAASRYLVWISVVGWLSVIFMIGAIIASIEYDAESEAIYVAFFLTIILVIAVGIIAAIASYKIGSSKRYPTSNTAGVTTDDTNLRDAYSYAVISAASALGSLIFAIIAIIAVRAKEGRPVVNSVSSVETSSPPPQMKEQVYSQPPPSLSTGGKVYYVPVQMG